ncbi:UDP-N-acetylmuramate--L-alanine ligase [Marinicauda pacifica]|jgi:UDP-N-acetylmuramate--alanine ligase|uniref:UDP-N-acetylmuramate--L-alanine ligase n=1 Tax=Marinicauda pacifica TaxID=1133559 RepID=A0A4S2HB68_9PROT|nr:MULTISPECIES: UDP-N-acetylmuramate--L-alanine ligase [Marinicauda]TGY92732.1 UDP-N-acetylmuramate--L-alanine ligase [Marinicauda pacifica]GGE39886.1 UDP-N-acetylmuramate--L-alanine ligase [Marinicauda pacifica]
MAPVDLAASVGPVHFVGIGGIGMSGIAEVMLNLGYEVTGSDIKDSANVERLRAKGATVHIGHVAENVDGAGALVVSSAVKRDNPELAAARARRIPVVRRAEMLAELMRLKYAVAVGGTHGKTTTTSLIAALMDGAGFDPTVINGGIISAYGSNAKMGEGDWMVVEADESDGSFLKLRGSVALITNIDPEHMEHYGSFDVLRAAFAQFVENLPFYGFAALCTDHPEVQALAARIEDRRVITYGFNPQAEVRAVNLRTSPAGSTFDLVFQPVGGEREVWSDFTLPMMGEHNVQNAAGALAVVASLGGSEPALKSALAKFGGVKRRFTVTGEAKGVVIVDDYGHHPVEISAVLKAARQRAAEGRVIAVCQPHRYSRLKDLFEDFCTCFNDADSVLVTPVYAAGEDPIEGADREALVAGLHAHGHRDAAPTDRDRLPEDLVTRVREGDLIVCLGAGDITAWAAELPSRLEAVL